MLVATAGHIDHGKTSLLRALTGVHTDRLPEERARGISIDLGFAYWRPDNGPTIGFVDVPGHERYVRNMLAGVGGVDCALLVVAVDDGIMPQTIEHVAMLGLLGITRALVALTKVDRVIPARLTEVGEAIDGLLAPTPLAGAAVFAVSSVTGDGVDALAAALIAARDAAPARRVAGQHFRLAIDRAFSVTGAGTVVTGTVLAGVIEPGERLVIGPSGHEVRVRGLQSGGRAAERIGAGERGAINLAGVEVGQIHRGDWLVPAAMLAPTTRIAARLELRDAPLRHQASVHLHHGTADIPARVLIPRGRSIAPGEAAMVELWLDRPALAVAGDRFVLRDQSGQMLLGGGVIADPFAPAHRRRMAARAPVMAAMVLGEAEAALHALLDISGHEIDPVIFGQAFNLTSRAIAELFASSGAVLVGKARALALPAARVARVAEQARSALAGFHLTHPEVGGMTPRELRGRLAEPVSADALTGILRQLIDRHQVEQCGALLRLPGHAASFSPAETAQWRQLEAWLDARGPRPFTLAEAMAELRLGEPATRALLYRRRLNGDLWQLANKRFLARAHVARLAAQAAELTAQDEAGFTAAQFRDVSGIGRNMVIEVLEFFDVIGVTGRHGNLRRVHADFDAIVGKP